MTVLEYISYMFFVILFFFSLLTVVGWAAQHSLGKRALRKMASPLSVNSKPKIFPPAVWDSMVKMSFGWQEEDTYNGLKSLLSSLLSFEPMRENCRQAWVQALNKQACRPGVGTPYLKHRNVCILIQYRPKCNVKCSNYCGCGRICLLYTVCFSASFYCACISVRFVLLRRNVAKWEMAKQTHTNSESTYVLIAKVCCLSANTLFGEKRIQHIVKHFNYFQTQNDNAKSVLFLEFNANKLWREPTVSCVC